MSILRQAHDEGERLVTEANARFLELSSSRIRRAIGLDQDPPPPCNDPETSYMPLGGAAREFHVDLPAMLVGGLASLLLQMTHPLAMAGVAQFSSYREDPLGRLYQTAQFIGVTTFGSERDALAVIDTVRSVHEGVSGVAPDGRRYEASDPHLLAWVHTAETAMFLKATELYGPRTVTAERADQYVAEMARVARDLGVLDPATSKDQLWRDLEAFRPELTLIEAGKSARNFVLRGVSRKPHEVATYATLVAAAVNLLPDWSRSLLGLPRIPLVETLLVRPAATAACATLRFAVPVPDITTPA